MKQVPKVEHLRRVLSYENLVVNIRLERKGVTEGGLVCVCDREVRFFLDLISGLQGT